MSRDISPRVLWFAAVVVFLVMMYVARGCGMVDDFEPFVDEDVQDTLDAGVDASVDADTSIDTRSTNDTASDAADVDVDAYVLPANSITSCADFFDCTSNCPPGTYPCTGACHDAMTPQAASLVAALIGCVNSSGCQNEFCMLEACGALLDACFNTGPFDLPVSTDLLN